MPDHEQPDDTRRLCSRCCLPIRCTDFALASLPRLDSGKEEMLVALSALERLWGVPACP
jgi:hypothetical protein